MHFDVIIGNPPYQLGDSGFGASARPIYQLFVNQAKSLDPRFLCMVIPARWFAGGKGLDDFRISMLSDTRIRVLHDYLDSSAIFKGTNIEGGVCYFLWDRDNHGDPTIFTHDEDGRFEKSERPLLESESDIYIRYSKGIEILRKVFSIENTGRVEKSVFKLPLEKKFSQFISARKPFGIPTDFRGAIKKFANSVKIFQNGGTAYIDKSKIKAGHDLVKNWKVFVPYARGGSQFPNVVIGKPIIGEPNSVCSETYLSIGPFASEQIAENVCSYMSTRLFRLLVLLRKSSQHVTRGVYDFVPLLDFSEVWTDEKLYERYGIAKDEIAFIERMIRPMDLDGE